MNFTSQIKNVKINFCHKFSKSARINSAKNAAKKLSICEWHLHIIKQSADGAFLFVHIGSDLSNHGFEQNNCFSS